MKCPARRGGADHAVRLRCVAAVACAVTVCAATLPLGAQSRGWTRYQSAHIVLLAPAGQEMTRLLDELERARADVRAYGLMLRGMIPARCYATTADFVHAAGASAFNLALARGGRIHLQPIAVLMRRGELARALRHEITHLALDMAARRGLPRWLNEGMAMSVAGEKQTERLRFARLSQLEDTLAHSRSYDNVRSAYGTAERLTAELIAAHGREKVLALLAALGSGSAFEVEFRRLTGFAPDVWAASRLPH